MIIRQLRMSEMHIKNDQGILKDTARQNVYVLSKRQWRAQRILIQLYLTVNKII